MFYFKACWWEGKKRDTKFNFKTNWTLLQNLHFAFHLLK